MLERFMGAMLRGMLHAAAEGNSAAMTDYTELDEPAKPESASRMTTDLKRTGEHEPITWDLILLVEHEPVLKSLLMKSIQQAAACNPDRTTNPVYSLSSYYAFIDRAARAMPWAVSPTEEYSALYDRIDQSMGCFYFVCDQPLKELEGRGYYHNSLMYHEPYRSWLVKFTAEYGMFLNTEESWCEDYYRNALEDPLFQLDRDLYESPENWRCFNDFFARKLKEPSRRPIETPKDEMAVVSPADAVPQGLWQIGEDNRVYGQDHIPKRLAIKTGTLTDVSVLLGGSRYSKAFAGGALTHTLLDVHDYHRYHFPADGSVLEVSLIPGDDAAGGVIVWDPSERRYKEYGSEDYGWQSIETRGVVILRLKNGGLAAIVPVGMCEVASVNFEQNVKPGLEASKGDPLGYFLFGGSDIIMLFSRDAAFSLLAEEGKHLCMGRLYGRIGGGKNCVF